MLGISQPQFDALSVQYRVVTVERLTRFLRESCTEAFGRIAPAEQTAFVESGLTTAEDLGITYHADIGFFLALQLEYGADLMRAPQPEALRALLSEDLDGRVKIERVVAHLGGGGPGA